jgi:hypothetical protein
MVVVMVNNLIFKMHKTNSQLLLLKRADNYKISIRACNCAPFVAVDYSEVSSSGGSQVHHPEQMS